MPITQVLNSKGNVKKPTNQDLPFSPAQPVLSKYGPIDSTSGQTVINLTFSVDQTLLDQFFLAIDGKILSIGAANDFVFTSVAADNTSSQVTLTTPIAAGLNIQAWKLGLKKEAEFQTDNRFVVAYDYLDQALPAFIATNQTRTATSTPGTPASGTFYSSIVNRASMVDLSQDMKVRAGVTRIPVSYCYEIQSEFGPNNERVFGALNDNLGQIRIVGTPIISTDSGGQYIQFTATTTDFVEVTFYGTGLNMLRRVDAGSDDLRATVDGGSEGANFATAGSNVIASRNYNQNAVTSVVSGLTLGVHTVKIRRNSGNFNLSGFEILNEAASLQITPGVIYSSGKKRTTTSTTSAFSSSFESGVLSTRGGRVLVYQKSDGTIGKAVTPTNVASAFLTSSDHASESVIRSYYPREFGASRTDDFSRAGAAGTAMAFTLEDGTTSLVATSGVFSTPVGGGAINSLASNASNSIIFTFVGTGLDVITNQDTGGGTLHSVSIDGASSAGNLQTAITGIWINEKICSGLPYGTHTVKITRDAGGNAKWFSSFVVYGPKKPSLPSGAAELAEYNILADYSGVANTVGGIDIRPSTGVMRKANTREYLYVGSGWSASITASLASGYAVQTATSGDYYEYTFWGTGFELLHSFSTVANTATLNIDGALYTGAATAKSSDGSSTWTAGTGTWLVSSANGSRLQVTGLTLGKHTIRVTKATATDFMIPLAIDIVTPIHMAVSDINSDLQNTLPVGSCSLGDLRKTSPIESVLGRKKYRGVARGITSAPTVASSVFVPFPEMSLTVPSPGAWFRAQFSSGIAANGANANGSLAIVANGAFVNVVSGGGRTDIDLYSSVHGLFYLPVGVHKVDVYWNSQGTSRAVVADRIFTIEET